MLQLLVLSDVHTYTENIRLALRKLDRTDAILIAGDLEAEKEDVLEKTGSIPCYLICGNNDYYINTEYPEELLIDIAEFSPQGNAPGTPETLYRYPRIEKVTEMQYSTQPSRVVSMPSFFKKITPPSLAGKLAGEKRNANISHRILMTHGKEYNVPDTKGLSRRADMWDADIVIFGHTHKFADITERNGKRRLINPGCLIGDPNATIRTWGNYETCSFAVLRIGLHGEIDVQHLYL